jgi:hypothetical protein
MTQPSKGAAAFLTLFGLPFVLAGLAFIYAQLVSRGNFKTYEVVAANEDGAEAPRIGAESPHHRADAKLDFSRPAGNHG